MILSPNVNAKFYRALQIEYDQLKQAHTDHVQRSSINSDVTDDVSGDQNGGGDAEMMAEARLLRQHKSRLEARMKVLEEHNEQLDSQLKRLRQLLSNNEGVRLSGEFMCFFNVTYCKRNFIFVVSVERHETQQFP